MEEIAETSQRRSSALDLHGAKEREQFQDAEYRRRPGRSAILQVVR